MKMLFVEDFRLCVLRGEDAAVDVSALVQDIPHTGPHDLISGLIARFEEPTVRGWNRPPRPGRPCRSPGCASARLCPSPATSSAWR